MRYILCIALISMHTLMSCPFNIRNDTQQPVFIADAHNPRAIYIPPEQSQVIDPSLSHWAWYWLYSERLYVYVPYPENVNRYYKAYELVEKYCTVDTTNITMSDIQQWVQQKHERFTVYQYQQPQPAEHQHDHAH